jgi:hypothetical protein
MTGGVLPMLPKLFGDDPCATRPKLILDPQAANILFGSMTVRRKNETPPKRLT